MCPPLPILPSERQASWIGQGWLNLVEWPKEGHIQSTLAINMDIEHVLASMPWEIGDELELELKQ